MGHTTKARTPATPTPRGRAAAGILPAIVIDEANGPAMHRQVYSALRDAMLGGRMGPGSRLPASRALARHLGLSRTTIALAYDQLRAEGYLTGRERSGTFVAASLPDDTMRIGRRRPAAKLESAGARHRVERHTAVPAAPAVPARPSARGRLLGSLVVSGSSSGATWGHARAFRYGTPALSAFPSALWRRLYSRRWRTTPAWQLGYGDPQGYAPLRESIAEYARVARGVRCDAAQVLIVNGSQQGLDLVARVLLDPGDMVCLENPGYRGARAAFEGAGARIVPVNVDDEGLDIASAGGLARSARLAYVTPSHQFPLGVTMSVARRLALIGWARRNGAWIVEDDYDSEFRFRGRPLPCMQGLADGEGGDVDTGATGTGGTGGRGGGGPVVYMGTFSKTLFPALRLGYLIVPNDLVETFTRARAVADRHSPTVDQAVLADFIAEGHYGRHIRRVRELYAARQQQLLACLERELVPWLSPGISDAGMHLVAWLCDAALDDHDVAERASEAGVDVTPLSRLAAQPLARGALLLGYAAFDGAELAAGAVKLRGVFESLRRQNTARGPAVRRRVVGPAVPA